ncbi:MAG: sn-glycerol-1-phosphate dehydrogenase [Pseudomonadota bacterium]
MASWSTQLSDLIAPAVAKSAVTDAVLVGRGTLAETGRLAGQITDRRAALVMADSAGFGAAGRAVVDRLAASGFAVETLILPNQPLPKSSVEEAETFRAALAASPDLFPVSVGSGVINDLVKWAAFETDRRYLSVATAASMDGYTSAGAPLAKDGFKVTIPTRAPIAMLADLDVIAAAPPEMNGWGYGDLAGKIPAGGDWLLADAIGVEPLDDVAWPMVQDNLRYWLAGHDGIADGDPDAVARLFVGLTAVGFAMEFHGSSRPASGADHQIAHMWEMEGLNHHGQKVSHGAAVSIGCVLSLALFDWLIAQDLSAIDPVRIAEAAPDLGAREAALAKAISDPMVARKARDELRAKHVQGTAHIDRLTKLKTAWPGLRDRLERHLMRSTDMAAMLRQAGAPSYPSDIGLGRAHVRRTLRAAGYIRRRYTIFDLLEEIGQTENAFDAVTCGLSISPAEATI